MRTQRLPPCWRRDHLRAAPWRRDQLLPPMVTNWSQRPAARCCELAIGPNGSSNRRVGTNLFTGGRYRALAFSRDNFPERSLP